MKTVSARGNALFLILIAVALFAALSYAVTQSGRGSGTIDRENAQLAAGELVQQLQMIQTSIDRLSLTGCDKRWISVEGAPTADLWGGSGVYVNDQGAPTDKSCNIYDAAGAGLTYTPPPAGVLDGAQSGQSAYGYMVFEDNMTITGVSDPASSMYAVVPYVNDAACLAINKKISGFSAIPVSSDTYAFEGFKGSVYEFPAYFGCGSGADACGAETGCFKVKVQMNGTATAAPVNLVYMQALHDAP